MEPIALIVVGTGRMAHVRLRALLATGHVALRGVASRRIDRARAFAAAYGCEIATDDYRALARCDAESVLVAVPDHVQTDVVRWAIENGLHVLGGGLTGATLRESEAIAESATERGLVVECGSESRYLGVWESARDLIARRALGRVVAVQATALSSGSPHAHPLPQIASAFVNPLQWIFGDPLAIDTFARPSDDPEAGTNSITLLFRDDVVCNLLCGHVSDAESASWKASVYGTEASIVIEPADSRAGILRTNRGVETRTHAFDHAPDPFLRQAAAFCASIRGGGNVCRNSPESTTADVRVTEELAKSPHSLVALAGGNRPSLLDDRL